MVDDLLERLRGVVSNFPQHNAADGNAYYRITGRLVDDAVARIERVEGENRRLRMLIERDRSIAAMGVEGVYAVIRQYAHLLTGRGSYEFDDDTWRDEFRDAIEAIELKATPLLRLAADRSDGLDSTDDVMAARAIDLNVDRLKACEHIAEGEEGWETIANLCPSTAAVAKLRRDAEAALEPFARLADGYEPHLICEGGTTLTYPDDECIVLITAGDFDPDWLNNAIEGTTTDEIQVGDLRRARDALSLAKASQDGTE